MDNYKARSGVPHVSVFADLLSLLRGAQVLDIGSGLGGHSRATEELVTLTKQPKINQCEQVRVNWKTVVTWNYL